MRITEPATCMVHVAGRGPIPLVDLIRELGIDFEGVPKQFYYRGAQPVVVGKYSGDERYHEVVLDLGDRPDRHEHGKPAVVAQAPLPYVIAWGDLFEYEPGKLLRWSQQRKMQEPVFHGKQGDILFEVMGETAAGLRVRLPSRPAQEWVLAEGGALWHDRRPSKLELRLRELRFDNPFREDRHHPVAGADWLLNYAFRERCLLSHDGRINSLPIERWEAERFIHNLAVDEAIVALRSTVFMDDRNDWGAIPEDLANRYVAANWQENAPEQLLQQMTDMYLVEHRMIRSAMMAVASVCRMYPRESTDGLIS